MLKEWATFSRVTRLTTYLVVWAIFMALVGNESTNKRWITTLNACSETKATVLL